MATESIPRAEPHGRQANAGTQLALSIVAAVIGALIPELFGAATPAARLSGMLAAAVLPLLITWVGPWQPLRVGVGVAVATGAIAVTYLGGVAVDREAFPASEQIAEVVAPDSGEPSGAGAGTGFGGPESGKSGAVALSATEVGCPAGGDCDDVTVTNTGTGPLTMTSVEAEGEGFELRHDCGEPLPPGERCTITPSLADGGGGEGAVSIGHDGAGSPATVRLVANASPPAVALAFDGDPPCELTPEGRLRVPFDIGVTGEAGDSEVTVTAALADGTQASGVFAVGAGGPAELTLPDDGTTLAVAGETQITLTHDAGEQVLTLAVVLPELGSPQQPLDCVTIAS